MRDPNRIPEMLELIEKAWMLDPDLRFNQLVSNLQSMYANENENYKVDTWIKEELSKDIIAYRRQPTVDLFNVEDDKFASFLKSRVGD